MSHIFKFEENDLLYSTITSNPTNRFYIYNNTASYNARIPLSGAFTGSILDIPSGYISLYELNVDRSGSDGIIGTGLSDTADPFANAVINKFAPETAYAGPNPLIRPFLVKDGTRINFRTISTKDFNAGQPGDIISTTYPLSASISKEYYAAGTSRYIREDVQSDATDPSGFTTAFSGYVSHLYALKNTMNYYRYLSPHYEFSSSLRDLGCPRSNTGTTLAENIPCGTAVSVGLVSIPSIFYGSAIKQGSLSLKFYVTGTLLGELQDINKNGELIQVGPAGSPYSGSVAGVVLYNEGFLVLTGSWSLNGTNNSLQRDDYLGDGALKVPKWIYFAQSLPTVGPNYYSPTYPAGIIETIPCPHSNFILDFKGTTKNQSVTMFAHAPKNQLNHSNNPTYIKSGSAQIASTGSTGYYEYDKIEIKNTVSSSYNDPTGSFMKTTYISQIGIYDDERNLIAIAKLAKPVKKIEERELTFKLKLDL